MTTACIVLLIPCLPDLDLSSNRRRNRHYMAQARDTTTERERAAVELREAASRAELKAAVMWLEPPVNLHWTVWFPKGRRAFDSNGLAPILKVWEDAIVKDLRWLINDSPRYVRRVSYESVPSSALGPSMRLVIEPAAKE